MNYIMLLFGFIAAFFISDVSHAKDDATGPIVKHNIDYFTVEGKTRKDLALSLRTQFSIEDKKSPPIHLIDDKIIKHDLKYDEERKKCHVANLAVLTTINSKFPKWVDYNQAPREMQVIWDHASTIQQKHHQGAVVIFTEHTKILYEKLNRIRPRKNCELLKAKIKKTKKKYDKKFAKAFIKLNRQLSSELAAERRVRRAERRRVIAEKLQTANPDVLALSPPPTGRPPKSHTDALAAQKNLISKKTQPRTITPSSLKRDHAARHQASRAQAQASRTRTIQRLRQATQGAGRP